MKVPWWVWAIAGVIVVAGLLTPFASSLPDGLECVIHRQQIPVAETQRPSPLPDYQAPGVRNERASVFVAAAAGVLVVVLLTLIIGRVLARPRPPAGPETHESVRPS